jgi:hypothetical protein
VVLQQGMSSSSSNNGSSPTVACYEWGSGGGTGALCAMWRTGVGGQ